MGDLDLATMDDFNDDDAMEYLAWEEDMEGGCPNCGLVYTYSFECPYCGEVMDD